MATSKNFQVSKLGLTLWAVLVFFASTALTAHAQGPEVTSSADDEADGCAVGLCTLREAIADAADGDTVTFNDGLIGQTIVLSGQIVISRPLTIAGPGADKLTISGNNASRIFSITSNAGGVSIGNLTLQEGLADSQGGAIESSSTLTITSVSLLSNTVIVTSSAGFGGGAIYVYDQLGGLRATDSLFQNNHIRNGILNDADAGAIFVHGSLFLSNTKFISNTSEKQNGAVKVYDGNAEIFNSLFKSNHAMGGDFGALGLTAGNLLLVGSQFFSNTAADDYGAVYVNGSSIISGTIFQQNQASTNVGALYSSDGLMLTNTQFISNTAGGYAGAGAAWINSGATRVLNSLFQGNQTTDTDYGALYAGGDLTISGTTFSNNSAANDYGALAASGVITIHDSLFENNSAGNRFAVLRASTTALISNTRFISNRAGGNRGAVTLAGNSAVVNSLFTGNHVGGNTGAALYINAGISTINITHTTIASATLNNGSAVYVAGGTLNMVNSLVAHHSTAIARAGGAVNEDFNLFAGNAINLSGGVTPGTHSWHSNNFSDAGFVDAAAGDFHLTSDSWALNKGTDAAIVTDFDGDIRPDGGGFDLGYDETPYSGPVAMDDPNVSTPEDVSLVINPLVNDTDPDSNDLTITVITTPANGNTVISGTKQIVYTPDENWFGQDVLTYTIREPSQLTDTAVITITVSSVDDPPSLNSVQTSTDENTPVSGTLNATDPDPGEVFTYTLISQPAFGTATLNVSDGWIYTPTNRTANYTVTFTAMVSDSGGLTDTAIVTVAVSAQNNAPIATDDAVSTNEDTPLGNPLDVGNADENDSLSFSLTSQPLYGTASINASGSWVYTPTNRTTSYTVTFKALVADSGNLTDSATITVAVSADNDPPVATDYSLATDEDTPVSNTLKVVDADENDNLTFNLTSQPIFGTAALNTSGDWVYTPTNRTADYTDNFAVTVSDDGGLNDIGAITITVSADNDPPVAVDDIVATPHNTSVRISVLANDSDPDGNPFIFSAGNPSKGQVIIESQTTLLYTPTTGFGGSDTFSYTIKGDNSNLSDTATVTVNVMRHLYLPIILR